MYSDANSLREIVGALKRDKIDHSFVESWSSDEDVAQKKQDIQMKRAKEQEEEEVRRQKRLNEAVLGKEREQAERQGRREQTARLWKQFEPRAQGMTNGLVQTISRFLETQPSQRDRVT